MKTRLEETEGARPSQGSRNYATLAIIRLVVLAAIATIGLAVAGCDGTEPHAKGDPTKQIDAKAKPTHAPPTMAMSGGPPPEKKDDPKAESTDPKTKEPASSEAKPEAKPESKSDKPETKSEKPATDKGAGTGN